MTELEQERARRAQELAEIDRLIEKQAQDAKAEWERSELKRQQDERQAAEAARLAVILDGFTPALDPLRTAAEARAMARTEHAAEAQAIAEARAELDARERANNERLQSANAGVGSAIINASAAFYRHDWRDYWHKQNRSQPDDAAAREICRMIADATGEPAAHLLRGAVDEIARLRRGHQWADSRLSDAERRRLGVHDGVR